MTKCWSYGSVEACKGTGKR